MKLNILLLTVDALRFDRLSLSGYKYRTSPVIDRLAKNSIWCENAFSLAPSTQPSMPVMMTSTLPLSYGGYDLGVKNRPNMLPKVLKDNGYKTKHLVTFPWLRPTYGYCVGVDKIEHFYNITGIVGATVHTIRSDVISYKGNKLDSQSMLEKVTPLVKQCFVDLVEYSDNMLNTGLSDRAYFQFSAFVHQDYNYKVVKNIVQAHSNEFDLDPLAYINKHIVGLPKQSAHHWISREIKYKVKLTKKISFIFKGFRQIIKYKNDSLYAQKNKVYVDSAELTNKLISDIYIYSQSNKEKPFYLWTHFMDTHAPYCPGELPNWPNSARKYLEDVGYPDDLDLSLACNGAMELENSAEVLNARYDSCIRYTDEQLGRIVTALADVELLKDTLIIIAGDHGEELGEHGEYGHRFRFYEECINVPMLFYNPAFKEQKISGLTDLSDLAPTILDLVGIDIPTTYVGQSLKSPTSEKLHIQMEVFHRGNCMFTDKPVYMSIRTNKYKYIWKEWVDDEDHSGVAEVQLFNLASDKREVNNIAEFNQDVVDQLQEIISKRLSQINEYVISRNKESLVKTGVYKYLIKNEEILI